MKKQLMVSVPNPCQEGWHTMTPTEKGRFCGSCSKEVVDFSAMTDQQLFSYLKRSQGDLCGRFATDQLDRSIVEPTKPIKKTFWAVLFSFILPFIAFNRARAQTKPKSGVEQKNTENINDKENKSKISSKNRLSLTGAILDAEFFKKHSNTTTNEYIAPPGQVELKYSIIDTIKPTASCDKVEGEIRVSKNQVQKVPAESKTNKYVTGGKVISKQIPKKKS